MLDCLDTDRAPFAKGTLVGFRTRVIKANLDRRLVERSVEVALKTKAFGARALRLALDSSPDRPGWPRPHHAPAGDPPALVFAAHRGQLHPGTVTAVARYFR